MNLIELDKQIDEKGIWVAIQNGIRDAYLYGKRDDEQSHHYYNLAYEHMTRLKNVKETENE